MKVTLERPEEKKEEIAFPCLMIAPETDAIILATLKNEDSTYNGFCLDVGTNPCLYVGEEKDYWSCKFTPLPKGTKVILEN